MLYHFSISLSFLAASQWNFFARGRRGREATLGNFAEGRERGKAFQKKLLGRGKKGRRKGEKLRWACEFFRKIKVKLPPFLRNSTEKFFLLLLLLLLLHPNSNELTSSVGKKRRQLCQAFTEMCCNLTAALRASGLSRLENCCSFSFLLTLSLFLSVLECVSRIS